MFVIMENIMKHPVFMFQGKVNFLTGHPVVTVTFCNADFLLLKNKRAQRLGS